MDIRAMVNAMVHGMKNELAGGHIVRLGDLDSLRISISSQAEDNADDVNPTSMKGTRTIFTPGKDQKETLKNLEYAKA